MNPFQGLKIWGMILLFVVSCKKAIKEEVALKGTKPNIILIMADDQGWGDLSSSGNNNLNTPNIDAIGQNGVSFVNFFVQPVCSPTRAELLTGRHFPRLGVYETSSGGERMNLGETTLADIFKEAGYKTAAYGKWHNGMQPPYHPNARGFDDYYGFASGHWGNYFSPMLEHNGEIVQGTGYLADDLTDHSIEFMEKNQKNPFLLYLPFNTPHSPMQVPDAYWNRFTDKELIQKYQGPEPENENFTRSALAMVENIDYNVGRVMAKLKQLHLEENTIVIYLSDNGPNGWRYNGGMRGKKGSTDEGGVRTPFFVQWKNTLPKGKIVTPIATALDILPTLSHLAGIEVRTERPIDGMDLSPLLFENDPTWKDRLIFNHWNGNTSVRNQNYRLDAQDRLYDMENDHGQMRDISAEYPQLTDSLKTAKAFWLSAVMPIEKDDRPFTLGDPDFEFTQLPARDAVPHGNIARSNRFPNDTYFTNWISTDDFVTWDVLVLADGEFEVQLYYACAPSDVGTTLSLSHGRSRMTAKVTQANDAPLKGMENDRDPRMESYIKDFKPMTLGKIALKKGRASLTLKAMTIAGEAAPEFRLLLFKRLR